MPPSSPPPPSGGPPPNDAPVPVGTPPPTGRLPHPRSSRRVVIGGLVLLVALLTVVTALLARPHSDPKEPGAAAMTYFVAQDRHDYAARWVLMTPRFQSAWASEAAFVAYLMKLDRDTQSQCCQLSQVLVQETTVEEDRALVRVARIYTGNRGTGTDNAYLRRMNGRWLVDDAGEERPPGWLTP